jgi:hypothetical protein
VPRFWIPLIFSRDCDLENTNQQSLNAIRHNVPKLHLPHFVTRRKKWRASEAEGPRHGSVSKRKRVESGIGEGDSKIGIGAGRVSVKKYTDDRIEIIEFEFIVEKVALACMLSSLGVKV